MSRFKSPDEVSLDVLDSAAQRSYPRGSDYPCRKCGQKKVFIYPITSGDHDDYYIKCSACGDRYCEEGPDS